VPTTSYWVALGAQDDVPGGVPERNVLKALEADDAVLLKGLAVQVAALGDDGDTRFGHQALCVFRHPDGWSSPVRAASPVAAVERASVRCPARACAAAAG